VNNRGFYDENGGQQIHSEKIQTIECIFGNIILRKCSTWWNQIYFHNRTGKDITGPVMTVSSSFANFICRYRTG